MESFYEDLVEYCSWAPPPFLRWARDNAQHFDGFGDARHVEFGALVGRKIDGGMNTNTRSIYDQGGMLSSVEVAAGYVAHAHQDK